MEVLKNTMQIPENLLGSESPLDRFCVILKGKEKVYFGSVVPHYEDADNSLLVVDHTIDLEGQRLGFLTPRLPDGTQESHLG